MRPKIPRGLRDILPVEARERRDIERTLRELFYLWGYGEVISPTFEFYEQLATDAGESITGDMLRFFDRDTNLLALRPEMTIPIARLAAMRLKAIKGPHRLFYIANVFREELAQMGQSREFFQAGIELIDASGPQSDAEVLGLLISSLEKTGLKDFRIGVGQVAFLRSVFSSFNIPKALQKEMESTLAAKNIVGFKNLLARSEPGKTIKETLVNIVTLRGGLDALRNARELPLNEPSMATLEELIQTIDQLRSLGLEERILIDLGIVRDFDYYTGVIFEAYCPQLGSPLGGGGRYDNLLKDFDYPVSAAGFAFGIDRLHIALSVQNKDVIEDGKKILVYSNDHSKAMIKAESLRRDGQAAEVALMKMDSETLKKYATDRGFEEVIEVKDDA